MPKAQGSKGTPKGTPKDAPKDKPLNNRVVNGNTLAEERRRRAILAMWLLMFSVLMGVFVYAYFIMFGPERRLQTESRKCLACHRTQVEPRLALKYQHEPFAKERCTTCHLNIVCTKEKQAKIKGSLEKICFDCHSPTKGELKMKQVHVPFKGKRCTDCHDPHSSNNAHVTILPQSELCVSCHYGANFKQVFQHQPSSMRNCTDCHEPHGSDNLKHLVLPVNELCYSCHFKVARDAFKPTRHAPFDAGRCTDCHKPHSTAERKLLASSYNTLCSSCHPNIGIDFTRASHHPLGQARMETCGKCHKWHSADYRRLLPTGGTLNCYAAECHPGLQQLFDASEHNSGVMGMLAGANVEVACSGCHDPHGTDNIAMLNIDALALCQSCHVFGGTTAEGHAVFVHANGPPYVDRWHGGYMWCGSCHAFHGSPYPYMKLAIGDDLCLKCHTTQQLEGISQ